MNTQNLNHSPVSAPAPAHRLFPPTQAILWLPGFDGHAKPFCSYNFHWEDGIDEETLRPLVTDARTPLTPTYPVSFETFIAWNTSVTPPFPYHPVAITRPLLPDELDKLERLVGQAHREPVADGVCPVRNQNKFAILGVLARWGLLAQKSESVPQVA